MYQAKLFGIAAACVLGLSSVSPAVAYAAEANAESTTLSENEKSQKGGRAAFEDAMRKAVEKWNTLTDNQKAEVYALVEDEMKAEMRLLDKLVELCVMEKNDVSLLKNRMQERFNQLKASGEFPFVKQKGPKSRK
jgi:3-hydroxyacyl-CoA dehydrogenase